MKAKYKLGFSLFSNQGLLISSEYAGTLQCQRRSPEVSPRLFLGPMPSNRVTVFVVQCKIVFIKNHLAFVFPLVLDRWVLRLGVVVRAEGDLRLDRLCEGGGHSGSWLLRIEEACSGGLNFMSISLLFAVFVPVFATFVSDTRDRYPLRPSLRSRTVTLGILPLITCQTDYLLVVLERHHGPAAVVHAEY